MTCFLLRDYTILYYTILYYTILYYTILYYTILYYTTQKGTALEPLDMELGSKNHTIYHTWMLRDLVSLLSNGPHRAYYGFFDESEATWCCDLFSAYGLYSTTQKGTALEPLDMELGIGLIGLSMACYGG